MIREKNKNNQEFRKEIEQDIKNNSHKRKIFFSIMAFLIFSSFAIAGTVWYANNIK